MALRTSYPLGTDKANLWLWFKLRYKLPRPHEKHFEYLAFDDVLDYALQDLLPFYEESHRFMDECLASGGKILIHCQMGVSRSGSLVVSFLMRMNRWDFNEAYK